MEKFAITQFNGFARTRWYWEVVFVWMGEVFSHNQKERNILVT